MDILVLNAGSSARPDFSGAELRIPDPDAFFAERGINTGDLLVYDSTVRQLCLTRVRSIGFRAAEDPAQWPRTQPDVTIMRGSNYLMEGLDLGGLLPLLRHLKGPIVAVGLGAQAPAYRRLELPASSVAFWRLLADKCASVGVRGHYSAEVLESIGVRNVRVVGCPSFYRGLQAERPLNPLLPLAARVGLNLNRHLAGAYIANAATGLAMQRALLAQVARRPASRFYAQGEQQEMLATLATGPGREAARREVLALYGATEDPYAAELLTRRMLGFIDIDRWAADIALHVDVMIGFRLHGNVMALQQGIPAIPFVYDSRTREMAELFALPAIEVEGFAPRPLDGLIAEADFTAFPRAYARNFAAYRAFLEENALPHRLGGAAALTGPAETA